MHVRGYINKKSAERVSNKHTGNPDTENGIKLYGQFPNWKWTLTAYNGTHVTAPTIKKITVRNMLFTNEKGEACKRRSDPFPSVW